MEWLEDAVARGDGDMEEVANHRILPPCIHYQRILREHNKLCHV
jgi:hypothetical protein